MCACVYRNKINGMPRPENKYIYDLLLSGYKNMPDVGFILGIFLLFI